MEWNKLGIVYCPDGSLPWAKTHAMIPTPMRLSRDIIRVFITFCDENGCGRPGYVDVAANNPMQVLGVSPKPLLDLGRAGTFDENGLLVCSVAQHDDGRMFMYYAGFELGTKIRYRLLTGLAISDDGGMTFHRHSPTPVLERTATELFFRCGPYCMYEAGRFRLWYVGGSDWTELNKKPMPIYDIRYAESSDGIHWPDQGQVLISISDSDEHGFGRPFVIPHPEGGYRMFYSVRRRSLGGYRLGYAESKDGRIWNRMDDKLNLNVTPNSFDSDAIMYAAPIVVDDRLYVFYNGNNFGRDGFAVALLGEA